jgi:hypothetical protein
LNGEGWHFTLEASLLSHSQADKGHKRPVFFDLGDASNISGLVFLDVEGVRQNCDNQTHDDQVEDADGDHHVFEDVPLLKRVKILHK